MPHPDSIPSPEMMALFQADGAKLAELPSEEKLKSARELAQALFTTERSIEELEKQLEEAKQKRNELVQRTMPTYFDNAGIDRLGIPGSDMDVVVENYYHANIPKEKQEEAFKWLEKEGHEDLIKVTLTLQFTRGEYEFAKQLVERINQFCATSNHVPRDTDVKLGVPWNTLTAFVKEQHGAGVALPLELLGATIGRIVKLKNRRK